VIAVILQTGQRDNLSIAPDPIRHPQDRRSRLVYTGHRFGHSIGSPLAVLVAFWICCYWRRAVSLVLKNILRLLVGCRLCSLADTAGCSRRAQPLAYVVVFWPLLSGSVDSAGSRHTTLVMETNQRQRRATINRHCNNIAHAATAMMVQIVGNRNPSLFTSYLAEKLS
jgi:hypothetical protein